MRFLGELIARFGIIEWLGIALSMVFLLIFVQNMVVVSRFSKKLRKQGVSEFGIWRMTHDIHPSFPVCILAIGTWSLTILAILKLFE